MGTGSALMPAVTFYASHYYFGLPYAIGGYGGFMLGIIGMVMLQARDYTD